MLDVDKAPENKKSSPPTKLLKSNDLESACISAVDILADQLSDKKVTNEASPLIETENSVLDLIHNPSEKSQQSRS